MRPIILTSETPSPWDERAFPRQVGGPSPWDERAFPRQVWGPSPWDDNLIFDRWKANSGLESLGDITLEPMTRPLPNLLKFTRGRFHARHL